MDKHTQDMADRAAEEIEALLELRELSNTVAGESTVAFWLDPERYLGRPSD